MRRRDASFKWSSVGKRGSVYSLDQESTGESWPTIDVNLAAWIGHLGDTTTRWNNGFYVDRNLLDVNAAFLVDSGPIATLVSESSSSLLKRGRDPI